MYTKKNNIKKTIESGNPSFGTWVQMSSPEIVEAIGYQGYDFAVIDMEHGQFGFDMAYAMVRSADAAGVTPVVRIPNNDESTILKALDMGAMGVIVPNVNNKEQAMRAVKAAKYAPMGLRGACPWTRSTQYCARDWSRHAEWSNQETMIWLTIEGEEGVRNIDEILTVPNIDAVMIGAFDLSQSLGIPGQLDNPLVLEKVQEVAEKVTSHRINLVAAMLAEENPEDIKLGVQKWIRRGCKIMIIGGDRGIICNGFRSVLESAHRAL